MNDRQPIAPGILRDLRNLDPIQSTDKFLDRHRERTERLDAILAKTGVSLDRLDRLKSAGDLKTETRQLRRIARLRRLRANIEAIGLYLFAIYVVLCTAIGIAQTVAWIFGK